VPPGVDYVPFILLAGTILWIIVDARPMAAVAIWITWALGGSSVYFLTWHSSFAFSTFVVGWVWESLTLIALILALVGIRQLRRQSAL